MYCQSHKRFVLSAIAAGAVLLSPGAHAALGFIEPSALNSTAATDSTNADNNADIASDRNGNWVAVWSSFNSLGNTIGSDADILVCRSTNNGATWTAAAALATNAGSDAGSDDNVSIATNESGVWVAVWASTDTLGNTIGSDADILFARSTDNGATWSTVASLNSNAATDSGTDGYPKLATDGGLNWVAVWHSNDTLDNSVGSDDDIFVSRSSDGGQSWSTVSTLNSRAAIDSGSDVLPSVGTDGQGSWVTVWESGDSVGNTVGTDTDIFMAGSTNNGQSWSTMAPLNTNAASDSGNDRAPIVESDHLDRWVAVWYSNDTLDGSAGGDNDIFTATSDDAGATWTTVRALDSGAGLDSTTDASPDIQTDRAGNWLVAWNKLTAAEAGGDYDILVSASSDNGDVWSPGTAMYDSAAADVGNDFSPHVATDGAGNWAAAWQSSNTLNNTIGTDNDILVSISDAVSYDGLVVLSPNGGEKWKHGKKKKVLWSSIGNVGSKVRIYLLNNGSQVGVITSKTKNDGKYRWTVPDTFAPGSKYTVRVESKNDSSIADESDAAFKVKSAK